MWCKSRETPGSGQRRKRIRRDLHCVVDFLDGSCQLFRLNAKMKGQVLLHHVGKYLDLLEPQYFGLSFVGETAKPRSSRWLHPDKTLGRQLKSSKGEFHLEFRVRFYVENPSQLDEPQTRHFFFLQTWSDLVGGVLTPSPQTTCLLTGYYLQAKLAGSESVDLVEVLNSEQVPSLARQHLSVMLELAQLLKDQSVDQARTNFLDHVRRVEFYGVDLHSAEDGSGKKMTLGISHRCVSVYRRGQRVNGFSWCKIVRLFYKKKHFFIQLQRERFEEYDTVVGFRLVNKEAAKLLWTSCMEQHAFFRLGRAPPSEQVAKGLFPGLRRLLALNSCYTLGQNGGPTGGGPLRNKSRSKASTEGSAKAAAAAAAAAAATAAATAAASSSSASTSTTYRRYDNLHKIQSSSFAASPRPAWSSTSTDIHRHHGGGGGGGDSSNGNGSSYAGAACGSLSDDKKTLSVSSCGDRSASPAAAAASAASAASAAFAPSALHLQAICFADDDEDEATPEPTPKRTPTPEPTTLRLPLYLTPGEPRQHDLEYEVRLEADAVGVFGFNVRFDSGDRWPAVSRVAPDSPADLCYPPMRLNDRLLSVNGHCVDQLDHHQVSELFRDARQSSLVMLLRRASPVPFDQEDADRPAVELVLDPIDAVGDVADGAATPLQTAEGSVAAIDEDLRSGRLLAQFDLLPRCRPELSTQVARRDENLRKNRYGDIFPYDVNRVKLPWTQLGDYINASHVNMALGGAGGQSVPVQRYIAAQGPLPHTVEDFWAVVWHQAVSLVAMVTPEHERGQVKCHRYWPELGEIVRVADLVICCQAQQNFGHFLHNHLVLTDAVTGESRAVDHVQYVDWPDHGVPVSATHFVDYVRYAHALHEAAGRDQSPSSRYGDAQRPVLVHCSAGIGRTGAFILLDTALSLFSAGRPVHPLALVAAMRDQRSMMVQTTMQFQYVCECIVESAR